MPNSAVALLPFGVWMAENDVSENSVETDTQLLRWQQQAEELDTRQRKHPTS